MPRSPGQLPPEPRIQTVEAMAQLDACGFPHELFPWVHHNSAWGQVTPWGTHRGAHDGDRNATGENVATRRRIDLVTDRHFDSADAEWGDLIEQAWFEEPLAEDTGDKRRRDSPRVPLQAGIYLANPQNEEPMTVVRGDPNTLPVTSANCKVGRASSLHRREQNYRTTFAPHEVGFEIAAVVSATDLVEAEKTALAVVAEWRQVNPTTKGLTEWLAGVDYAEVLWLVRDALSEAGYE